MVWFVDRLDGFIFSIGYILGLLIRVLPTVYVFFYSSMLIGVAKIKRVSFHATF